MSLINKIRRIFNQNAPIIARLGPFAKVILRLSDFLALLQIGMQSHAERMVEVEHPHL